MHSLPVNKMTHSELPQNASPSSAQRRLLLQGLVSLPWLGLLPGCGGGGSSDGSSLSLDSSAGFTHPGLLHTEADFTRMRAKIATGEQPWTQGWAALTSSGYSALGQSPNPQVTIIRGGTDQNFATMVYDMERTYQAALRWKVSGDSAYAEQAVKFLNAWSSTMTTLTGNADRFIAAGLYGYQWANAAEIMRSYSGWATADVTKFQQWLLTLFYPLSHDFLLNHNGSNITNYWASWDLLTMAGILAMGVFCDRRDIYNEAISYFKTGRGNGAAAHMVYRFHPGHVGQWQESGRDQGHSTLSISCCAALCEMAWNQGDDLYGYDNNRFLAGAEYVAKSNLQDASGAYYTLPFSTYSNRQGTMTSVSSSGQPNLRPCWESIYNHYVHRKGVDAPWVATMAAHLRPEGNNTNGDQLSFGTLAYSRDALATQMPPSGLRAYPTAGAVLLSWWGCANATAYNVKRGVSAAGPFTTVAHGNTDPRTHTDSPGQGTWYYVVTGSTASGETGSSNVVRVVLPGELILHLPLNEGSGTTAADSSGNGLNATLNGGAAWGAGRSTSKALSLDGSSGYLALPNGVLSGLGDFTVALWVYANSVTKGSRIFDFGSSDIAYWCLFAADWSGALRATVTGTTNFGEQSITASSALSAGKWVHLVLTLSGTTGTLYVDGVAAATAINTAIDLAPFQLGNTTQNWLGRAQYASDPYFNGRMQDLRIYSGALSASEIAALAV